MTNLIINGTTQTLNGILTYDNVQIINGGILYVTAYDGTPDTGTLEIHATNILIDATSKIIADGRGFRGGHGPAGYGEGPGAGGGGQSGPGSGGGYGGTGGSNFWPAGPTYGTVSGSDIERGSGGACGIVVWNIIDIGWGGNGGGSVSLYADTITINGLISANGNDGITNGVLSGEIHGSGGGSGGGILLNGRIITIPGTIKTDGGRGSYGGVGYYAGNGGGGGRIKLFYSETLTFTGSATANPNSGGIGWGQPNGVMGTVGTIYNLVRSPTPITNWTFDTDISGWTKETIGDANIIWDFENARLRTWQCSTARMSQTIIIVGDFITFGYETVPNLYSYHNDIRSTGNGPPCHPDYNDATQRCWSFSCPSSQPDYTGWRLIVDGVTVIEEALPVGTSPLTSTIGTITRSVCKYAGKTADLVFFIEPTGQCWQNDHGHTYLWIDNVNLLTPATKGAIDASSTPAGAEIFVNNIDQGVVTRERICLDPGTYDYKLTLPWYYDVTGPFNITAGQTTPLSITLLPSTGNLDILSTPSGASIYIDDILQSGVTTPSTIIHLYEGIHTYKLTLYEYQDVTGSFNITAEQTTTITEILIPTLGHLNISSTPVGAEIFIDGIDQGFVTPSIITGITPGLHTYKLTLAGYYDVTGSFITTAGETTIIPTQVLVLSIGSLDISSTPSGAEIFIDNVDTGLVTPYIIPNISEGPHTYKLTLPGYYDTTGSFNIVGGKTTVILTQVLIPSIGSLDISSIPSGAEIFIDDIDQGVTTPYIIPNIPEGLHTYKLTLPGYYDKTGSFSITGGITTAIVDTLIQIPGTLDLVSTPPGAEIFINGIDQLITTPYLTSLLPGNYKILLTLANYVDRTITVTLLPGQTTTISTTLFPTANLLTDIRCGSPKFHINYSNTGQSIYPSYTNGTMKWVYSTTGQVRGSPAIDIDGTIYIGDSNANFYAFNPDGTLKWQSLIGGSDYSSPAIGNDGTIYTFGRDQTTWTYGLYAFNSDGTLKWNTDIGGYSETAPAIGLDGNIYIGTDNGLLYAFDPTNGSQVWLNNMFTNAENNCPAVSPVDGTIYAKVFDGSKMYLSAFNPTNGYMIWSRYIGNSWPRSQSPSIAGDGTVYIATADGPACYLYAINSVNGSINWQYRIGTQQTESYPAIATDGTIYIGNGDGNDAKMYAINPNGTLKWFYPVRNTSRSPPTIDLAGNIYFGTNGVYDPILGYNIARFYSLNPDGTLRWYKDIPTSNSIVSAPSIAPDGTIYVGVDGHWNPALAIGLVAFQSTYVAPPALAGPCPTVTKLAGDTVSLDTTPVQGVAPYTIYFKKSPAQSMVNDETGAIDIISSSRLGSLPNPVSGIAEGVTIERIYTLDSTDLEGATTKSGDTKPSIIFATDVIDSCTPPQSCIKYCKIFVGCTTPVCDFTVT